MKKEFTHQFMQNNCGCYSQKPGKLTACSFMKKERVVLNDILNSEIPLKDKYWFVCKKLATGKQNQMIAIGVAEIVLPIFEKRYRDKRAREAVEAAKQYIAGHISLDELMKKRAAYYSKYADRTANAAIYAIYAANYAVEAANDSSSYAAYNTYLYTEAAADYAVYAANAADDIKQQLLNFLIDFCEKA